MENNTSGQGVAAIVPAIMRIKRIGSLAVAALIVIYFVVPAMSSVSMQYFFEENAYQSWLAEVQANRQAVAELGEPITITALGSAVFDEVQNGTQLVVQFSVKGPKSKGMVYIYELTFSTLGRSKVIELQVEGRPDKINLVTDHQAHEFITPCFYPWTPSCAPQISSTHPTR